MFPDEFPQFRISCPDFPTLFPEVHWALSLELPYLRSSTELRWMSSGLHSEIRGTYSGKGHSARAEAKPFLLNPTLQMVSNIGTWHSVLGTWYSGLSNSNVCYL